ncbi:endonuclease/exonuclease/phosphatase family protein [uncultured Formosa sp.]|uniref:endonuclease/exonuclease/phosphatase family protein n=1 Tax=uncultured Formosa sp. TaxID=255435 RepID=UPI00260902E8|nr:endonuclease/exonuclease/phosphatase family protein [uncultured Formosa sp.]
MKKNTVNILILFLFVLTASFTSKSEHLTRLESNQNIININDSLAKIKSKTLKIASWNIRDLGRTKDDDEILQIARIIKDFDIVAIQEVVAKDPAGAKAIAKIADELNRMGSKWDYRISDPTKSPSVYISERYAFIWKTSKVKLSSRAYLDTELEEKCFREPFIGKFQLKQGTAPFYVINFHSRKFDEHPEQEIIFFKDYSHRLKSDSVFILGDFNLNETHKVWDNLYNKGFKSALKNTKTTLKTKCKNGNYLNHTIDNIYYSKNIIPIHSGVINFVNSCRNLEVARGLSDHLPVYLEYSLN